MKPRATAQIRREARVWLVPALYILGSLALGRVMSLVDRQLEVYGGVLSPGAAWSVLSAIATGMITFTGIVFAMTLLIVQFSSSAYSPRLAGYLLEDRIVRHALGMFIATFLYALVVLFEIDLGGSGRVPTLTVLVSLLGVLGSVVMFLALIQRVTALQVSKVLRMVGQRARQAIDRHYPPLGDDELAFLEPASVPDKLPPSTQTVDYHGGPAAVLEIDLPALIRLARRADAIIEIEYPVGDTVPDGAPLMCVRGGRGKIEDGALRRAVIMGGERSIDEDPKYAIRLVVDIAVKALSAAINDPTTAVQALDQLDDLLRRLGTRRLGLDYAYDQAGQLRVVYPTPDWEDFLALGIEEIRYYGANSIQVMRRLCALLEDLYDAVPPERRAAVEHHIVYVAHSIDEAFNDEHDRLIAHQADRQGIGLSRLPEED